jgi:ubiquinone/menaquinone biosynthesis C-methylase UbiE
VRPEHRLLLCCARTHIPDDLLPEIRALVHGALDWTELVKSALDHGVAPLLCDALERISAEAIPEELRQALRTHASDNLERNQRLLQELFAITDALAAHGIESTPFKGPTLALEVYGDLRLRRAGDDLDLMVRVRDLDRTCELLGALGFRAAGGLESSQPLTAGDEEAYRRYQCEYCFVRESDGMVVEPHWAIAPRMLAVPIDYHGLWDRTETRLLAGRPLLALAWEDLILVLCVHAAKHEWNQLRWICDLAELLGGRHAIDWRGLLESAREQGCERMLLTTLALSRDLLGAELEPDVEVRLRADRAAADLARHQAGLLFGERSPVPSIFELSAVRLRMRERWRDRTLCVLRTLTTPRIEHRQTLRLPHLLRHLNPLVKLAHDYAVMPLWHQLRPAAERAGLWQARATESTRAPHSRASWTARSAAWLRWADEVSSDASCMNRALAKGARLETNHRILDLASGVGEPALGVARRAEAEGLVVATDLVPAMLSGVQRRARAMGVGALLYSAADMQALPFVDAAFDRVLCRFGVMFCDRPDAALAEAYRVLKPGGRAAFLVWGPRVENTLFLRMQEAVAHFFDDVAPVASGPSPFQFAERGELARALEEAGFSALEERAVRNTITLPGEPASWRPQLEMTYGDFLEALPAPTRAGLERAIEVSLAQHCTDQGYRFATWAWLVVGQRC